MPYKKLKQIAEVNNYEYINIQTTTSTMNDAKKYLNEKNQNCIILSNSQTEGRGRRGSFWESPEGNIHCSITFKNNLEIKDHFLYSILICVSIKLALERFNAKQINFKWPNDIYHLKKKFGGVILETFKSDNLESFIIGGFGININTSPDIIEYPTTYAKAFTKIKNINDFLLVFFKILFKNIHELQLKNIIKLKNIFRESLMFKDEKIQILLPNNSILTGIFQDINEDGSLRLKTKHDIQNIYNGRIILC